ncbi:MAG: TIGR00366 family protein [Pyramidobacter porci]|uniref:short-chain fatty acid transporter n=1 Tax=Pyramidobacter porci TaxID=2605789 RepID=UPI002A75599D|nr:TIGR00366 family protein [Pyramidobacter porci]MDY2649360.1 TIGR00366 family protein [Pyramidobacter porci]
MRKFLQAMTNVFISLVQRWLPRPFTLSVILSGLVGVLGIIICGKSAADMVNYWGKGFFGLFPFTMQMVLIVVTGHALASAPIVQSMLGALATIPRGPKSAIFIVGFISCLVSYINWGFGLVIGALIAKEVAIKKRGMGIHYPLMIAAVYGGNVLRGPSSAIPLSIATPGHFLEKVCGIIPVSDTLFSSWNMFITVVLFFIIPGLCALLSPSKDDKYPPVELDSAIIEAELKRQEKERAGRIKKADRSPAERLDNSVIIMILLVAAGFWYLYNFFAGQQKFNLNLNTINFAFMMLGLLAHGSPARYSEAVGEAVKSVGGIILQFPFYAGMMGMMRDSGLTVAIANFFVSISSAKTLPLFTFWSAGLINIFIPSGGGQWAVQGPIMMEAARALNADGAKVAMALCWGDSWTNQIQPFWALTILAIAGLGVRDIMGYCLSIALLVGVFISAAFILL